MKKQKKSMYWMLFAFTLTWAAMPVLSAPLYSVIAPTSPVTIQIGVLLPLTGAQSETGNTAKATIEVAIEDFQREFSMVTLQPLVADTASDPATALAQLKSLAAKGVKICVGPFSSAEAIAIKSFADQNNIIMISPTATAPSLAVNDTIFRISLDDSKQSIALSALVAKRGITAVVPIVRNDLYGKDLIANFITQFQKAGGITADPIYYDGAAPDYQSIVAQARTATDAILKANGNAKIGILAVSFDEITGIFVKASADSLLSSLPWFGTDSSAQSAAIGKDPVAAAFAEKTQFTASISSDYNVVSYPYLPFIPIDENMLTKVIAKYPTPKSSKVAPTYDALWMAGMACFKPYPTLKDEVIRVSKDTVGYTGSIYFGPTGDRGYGWFAFYRFMSGKWVLNAAYTFTEFQVIPQPLTEYLFDFAGKEKVIKIGALMPLTGANAAYGVEMNKLLQKSEIDINAVIRRYYSASSRVEYIIEDTKTDPDTAYNKLVSMKGQGVEFVIGPTTSAEMERVAPYANQNGIILISPSSTSMSMAQKDYIFRLTLNDEKHCSSLAALMLTEGITGVEIIYRNDTFGQGFKEYFTKAYTGMGGKCGEGIAYDPKTTNYQSIITQAEEKVTKATATYGLGKTAVLFVAYDEAVPFMEAISPNSILSEVRWFGTDGFTQSPQFAKSPKAANFAAKTKLTASTSGTDVDAMLIYQRVMDNDLSSYLGAPARAYDVSAYDAAWLIAQFSIFSDWYPSTDSVSRVTNLASIASMTASYLATNVFDENGDRTMGNITFYQVRPINSTIEWKQYAAFVFFNGQTGPFYYEKNTTSNVLSAPELK